MSSIGEHQVITEPLKLYIGRTHDRPDPLPFNLKLKELGSKWRVTRVKCAGLVIMHTDNQVYRCPDSDGLVSIPDVESH